MSHLSDMVDEALYRIGDGSTSVDWYMKRTGLVTIYAAAEMHMLNDQSEEFVDTYWFLERRLNEASGALANMQSGGQMLNALSIAAQSLASAIPSILNSPKSTSGTDPEGPFRNEQTSRMQASASGKEDFDDWDSYGKKN